MSYSNAQKDAVRGSWARARESWGNDGSAFFLDLFSKKPDFYNHFNTLFKGKSLEAAKGSPELSAQAQSFKGMLNIWTENLDDPGTLTVQTLRFAKLHKARGVTADQIQFAFDLFVDHMRIKFGADSDSWNAVIKVIMGIMRPAL